MKRLLNQWLPMAQLLRLQPIQMLLTPALLGKLLFLFFFGLVRMECHAPLELHWFSCATLRAWLLSLEQTWVARMLLGLESAVISSTRLESVAFSFLFSVLRLYS